MDIYSCYYVVIPLTVKSNATIELMNGIRRTEKHFKNHGGYKVAHFRTDSGGEFIMRSFVISLPTEVLLMNSLFLIPVHRTVVWKELMVCYKSK